MMAEEELWRTIAPAVVFCIVLLLQLITLLMRQMSSIDKQEAKLLTEVKSVNREANALVGPSTFAQAAKLKRIAATKERELNQLKQQAKEKGASGSVTSLILKIVIYVPLLWWFWSKPVASVPADLIQPFAKFMSWPLKFSHTQDVIHIGILPWLLLSTHVSFYVTNTLFARESM